MPQYEYKCDRCGLEITAFRQAQRRADPVKHTHTPEEPAGSYCGGHFTFRFSSAVQLNTRPAHLEDANRYMGLGHKGVTSEKDLTAYLKESDTRYEENHRAGRGQG